jgi:hypothetical protein
MVDAKIGIYFAAPINLNCIAFEWNYRSGPKDLHRALPPLRQKYVARMGHPAYGHSTRGTTGAARPRGS